MLSGVIFSVLPPGACDAAYPEQLIKVVVTFRPEAAPTPSFARLNRW